MLHRNCFCSEDLNDLHNHEFYIFELSINTFDYQFVLHRNCFCSEDLNDLLRDLVANYGNVDTFVLSLQNCRFLAFINAEEK